MHGVEVWITQNRSKMVKEYGIYKTFADKGVKPIPGEKTKRLFVRTQMGHQGLRQSLELDETQGNSLYT